MIAAIRTAPSTEATILPPTLRSATSAFADIFADATAPTGKATSQGASARAKDVPADAADKAAELAKALAAFRKEASLTPAQRARRDVIEAMGLTEDAIKAMPPEQRDTVETKIAAEVARRLRVAASGDQTGPATALTD